MPAVFRQTVAAEHVRALDLQFAFVGKCEGGSRARGWLIAPIIVYHARGGERAAVSVMPILIIGRPMPL